MQAIKVGITIGDINGIGIEVILKSLDDERLLKKVTPVIYGSGKVLAYHKKIVKKSELSIYHLKEDTAPKAGRINMVNCWDDEAEINLGQITESGGKYAYTSLEKAVEELRSGRIDCLVTAPINKKAMRLAGFMYPGHTEYLADNFDTENYMMMMVQDDLRVSIVTEHLPLSEVVNQITKERIVKKVKKFSESLKADFGVVKPVIAVMGLNPHSGDGGVLGSEEEEIIIPAIEECKAAGIQVLGPYGADGFFGSGMFTKFDGILAMYHDQGLIPFKTISGQSGVNFTAGLPIVRTSPDHGTAFDKAGQNQADERSMRNAIHTAIDIVRSRKEYAEDTANPLKRSAGRKERY